MLQYTIRRILLMIPTLIVLTMVTFFIIQLPPGDFLHFYVSQLSPDESLDQEVLEMLEQRYGLNQPVYVQYLKWVGLWPGAKGLLQGEIRLEDILEA